jgi:hypothetical protein
MHDEDGGRAREHRDRLEIADRVVAHLVEHRIDRVRAGARHEEGVAVGRGVRHGFRADRPSRAAAVVHHHGPPELGGHLLGDDAADHVIPATRRERDHEAHRFDGISLGVHRGGGSGGEGERQCSGA